MPSPFLQLTGNKKISETMTNQNSRANIAKSLL